MTRTGGKMQTYLDLKSRWLSSKARSPSSNPCRRPTRPCRSTRKSGGCRRAEEALADKNPDVAAIRQDAQALLNDLGEGREALRRLVQSIPGAAASPRIFDT
jgi:hypothetical protein